MNTTSSCCGGNSNLITSCTTSIAELPRYYPRQLITPDDLTLEQNYFRDRMRRHNRLLHGWGVVCGALVCPVPVTNDDGTISYSPWQVQVQSGYVLGPYGDEIVLDCPRTIDVRTQGVSGVSGEPCIDVPDPWCTQVFTPPATTQQTTYFIAVKYQQSMTRPVRVQPVGCGCGDSACEYSRWHDGYQIGVLTECPSCSVTDANHPAPKLVGLVAGDCPACPPCDCGPWVGLAAVTVNSDGTIAQIDNCSCRRLVMSFSTFWWKCTGTLSGIQVADPTGKMRPPFELIAGNAEAISMVVSGTNLDQDATFTFGDSITVTTDASKWTENNKVVNLSVLAAADATPGTRPLIVVNKDCSTALAPNAISVIGSSSSSGQTPVSAPKGARMVGGKPKKPNKPLVDNQ
jgi:hypothetical protein